MRLKEAPLARHITFNVTTHEQLIETVATRLGAQCLQLPWADRIDSKASHFRLRNSELWYCAYGLPITLQFEESDYLRVQFGYAGSGTTNVAGHSIPITESHGCISSASAIIDFGLGFEQLVWRVPLDVLKRKLSALTGQTVTHSLRFEPVLNFEDPESRELLRILNCILITIEQVPSTSSDLVLAEMEQAMLVALLCRGKHNFRHWLDTDTSTVAPWQVRRVEAYIEANWNQPFSIENIAKECGASARSIYRTFRETRNYSPLEFAKRVRLQRARSLLEDAELQLSVTEVALACGYNEVSHFSRDFSRTHDIAPSAIARRRRR